MTATNNDANSNALSLDQQPSVLNFNPNSASGPIMTPPPQPGMTQSELEKRAAAAGPEDTQELPVHPGIPVDETPAANSELLKELQRVAHLPSVPSDEVLQLFETFIRVARNEPGGAELANKNAEIGQLKELLLEAQETIISLLNDRVLDRAKMAKLEAEVRLLPDLQSQATRAMGLAMKSEDVQSELESVRAEVERLRTSYMRTEHKKKGFFARLFGQ